MRLGILHLRLDRKKNWKVSYPSESIHQSNRTIKIETNKQNDEVRDTSLDKKNIVFTYNSYYFSSLITSKCID